MNPEILSEACFPSAPESASKARDEVRKWLGENHPAYENARLAVSELMTNAVQHAGREPAWSVEADLLLLRLTVCGDLLRIEVTDSGWNTQDPRIRVDPVCHFAESGRGLTIVSVLSGGNWGHRSHGPGLGRTVWCEIPAAPPSPEADPR